MENHPASDHIKSLVPRGSGHHFVVYGDACSGVPGAPHEKTFAAVNAVLRRLKPFPEFIAFLGDEIVGLTASPDQLRAQWRYWLGREMGWLDRKQTPLWHTTSNHTTYDAMSESIFRQMLPDIPHNGPEGQEGLSYWVRHGDLLLVFVHTLWTGLGGEGHVETDWLARVLREHDDVSHKIVLGHHPIHPVNGFSGAYQREVGPEHGATFWDTLVDNNVLAYFCSHILAFDVQVHRGVLQICTAGAGTAHRMPEGIEYLHCVQACVDHEGLRYQVLDTDGKMREGLAWPVELPEQRWTRLPEGRSNSPISPGIDIQRLVALRVSGKAAPPETAGAQTLLSAFNPGEQASLWLGFRGPDQRLCAIVAPEPGRSPHYWLGPSLLPNAPFELELLLHGGMGPGGLMYRLNKTARWTSLSAASPWGMERLSWPAQLSVGCGQRGQDDMRFFGSSLAISVLEDRLEMEAADPNP